MSLFSAGWLWFFWFITSKMVSHSIFDECVVVQRDTKLIALAYVSDLSWSTEGQTPRLMILLKKIFMVMGMSQRFS